MHETQRFALALAGIGGCIGIAAGIVVTGLADVPVVPVPNLPPARAAQTLPRLPMPSWSDMTSEVATARTRRKVRSAPSGSNVLMSVSGVGTTTAEAASAPVDLPLDPFGNLSVAGEHGRTVEVATPLDARPVPLLLSGAPRATSADVVVAQSRTRERDAVTGAFVTAGSQVGKSFRTVGRTLKRVF